MVVVSDPDNGYRLRRWTKVQAMFQSLGRGSQTIKENRYVFDRIFDSTVDTHTVYMQSVWVSLKSTSIKSLTQIGGVIP